MNSTLFRYSGRDALPQFAVFFFVFGAGALPLPFMIYHGWGVYAVAVFLAAAAFVAVGLRFTIVVSAEGVRITRSWIGIPYWSHWGHAINDVYFGGDWGEAEGASGIVLDLDGREVHVGSGRSMGELHSALQPFVKKRGEGAAT